MQRVLSLTLSATLGLTALLFAQEAGSGAKGKAELMADYRDENAQVKRKLSQIRVLDRMRRYEDVVRLCREVLAIQPGNPRAKTYLRMAQQKITKMADQLSEIESTHRDAAVIKEVGRWSMPPRRGPDVKKPDMYDLPFRPNASEEEKVKAALGRIIPEINVVDTDVSYVLQLLFKTHDINIIYPPDVVTDKKITIQARNISLGDILTYLSRNQGLHYTVKNGVIWLYSQDDDASEGGSALFQSEIIQLNTGLTISQSGNQSGDEEGEAGVGSGLSDIEAMMEWMQENWPGWPSASTWRLDKKHNRLIICSTPDIIKDVKRVVSTLDSAPTQVLITAVFVKISEDDYKQLGLSWNVYGNRQPNIRAM
ncbi:MAG: secretin and TonB N-terminal domain-containing protein, partial [Planctomycetota bacterium]